MEWPVTVAWRAPDLGGALVALALLQGCAAATDHSAAEVTAAVGRLLSARCTLVIRESQQATGEVVKFQKQLSNLFVQTSVVPRRQLLDSVTACTKQSLCVLPRAGNSTPSLLQHARGWLRDAAWLLLSAGPGARGLVRRADVPPDSLVLVARQAELREVYRVSPHLPLRVARFAAWRPGAGLLRAAASSLFARRRSLRGLRLRVAAHGAPPMVEVKTCGNVTEVTSYIGAVWGILQQFMGFSWQYVRAASDAGSLVNGSWTGCLGAVARGEVDVVLGVFLATAKRHLVADFLHDTWKDTYVVYTKAEAAGGGRYLAPFSPGLWCAVLGLVLLCGGLASAFRACRAEQASPWASCVHAFVAVLCSRGLEASPGAQSSRLLELAMQATGLVLAAAYSSQLVSYIAVAEYRAPFQSVEQLVADGSYSLATRAECPLNEELAATRDPVLREMYARVFVRERRRRLATNGDNLRLLCRDPHRGFIVEQFEAERELGRLPCRLAAVPQRFARASGYLLFARRRPHNEFFKIMLQSVESSGILQKLRNDLSHTKDVPLQQEAISVSLGDAWFLYSVLGLGLLLSAAFLLLELFVHAHVARKKTRLIPYFN